MASKPTSETSSRSSTSSAAGAEETRIHSAVHVLRGAVTLILGKRRVAERDGGRISVETDHALSQSDVSRVQDAANGKVGEDAEFLEFEMEWEEAEGHFGPHIYDLSPAREGEGLVRVVRIPDWDACVCWRGHVETTGLVGPTRLEAGAYDEAKGEQELRFKLA